MGFAPFETFGSHPLALPFKKANDLPWKRMVLRLRLRFIIVICIIICAALPTGCSRGKTPPSALAESFRCNISVKYKDMEIAAKLTKRAAGEYRFELESPAELRGLALTVDSNGVTLSRYGLAFELTSGLPDTAFAAGIRSALEAASRPNNVKAVRKDNMDVYTGECGSGRFTLCLDQNGAPVSLSLPAIRLDAGFSGFETS